MCPGVREILYEGSVTEGRYIETSETSGVTRVGTSEEHIQSYGFICSGNLEDQDVSPDPEAGSLGTSRFVIVKSTT